MTDQSKEADDLKKGAAAKKEDQPSDIEARAEALAEAKVAALKKKLDEAYGRRDTAEAKAKELEAAAAEAKLAALKAEGREKEALQVELADLKKKLDAANQQVTSAKRDAVVQDALSKFDFRSSRAKAVAMQDIIGMLKQTDKGEWVGADGSSIAEVVEVFLKDPEQSFLLNVKSSNGGGGGKPNAAKPDGKPSSLFGLTTAELLKRAGDGTLRK